MGRDKFFDLLRKHHLLIKQKRRKIKTTISYHRFHRYPNLIKEIKVKQANEVWVSDITYIWLDDTECFCFLSVITDLYSRKIIGFCPETSG